MQYSKVPRHVAIVMDGNGRWAERKSLPHPVGHRAGVKAVRRVVSACCERDVAALTLFAFSSESWRRPAMEVGLLMKLFLSTLRAELRRLQSYNVRLRFIGERRVFPEKLRFYIGDVERQTATNDGLTLVIAANYSGRWDILQAAQALAQDIASGRHADKAIHSQDLHSHLCLNDLPEPDLLIRTGGERRLSNFLLWQLAYTEFYFTERLWPDYDENDLDQAFAAFAKRQRRFGKIGEQVM